MVSALDRKLLRDLLRLKGQIVTVALVVGAGLGTLVAMYSTLGSIDASQQAYYEASRFADVFARARKVPDRVTSRLETVPGVQALETRIVEAATIPLETMVEPVRAQIVSIPATGQPALNRLHLAQGRWLDPERPDEALVLETFAHANDLAPGDTLPVVMGGALRQIRVAGFVMSPEYVFYAVPGEVATDDRRKAVLWMRRDAVEAAFGMEGAFNDLVVDLQPGATEDRVVDEVDRILAPYGGLGAYPRERQRSHAIITQERDQLRAMGAVIPLGFLGVAAFLLNVVLTRLVQLQRGDIATLKAVGYTDRRIALHFLEFALVVLALGGLVGAAFGAWIGDYLFDQYALHFTFPNFRLLIDLRVVGLGAAVALVAGLGGALGTVYRVMRLPPAEAMRPPAPAVYRRSLLDRVGLFRLLSTSVRMVVREIERRPLRSLISLFGLSLSVALLVFGRFGWDTMERLIAIQFRVAMREDISITYREPQPPEVEHSIAALPGVLEVESQRSVPARFVHDHRDRYAPLIGVAPRARMRRLVDEDARIFEAPPAGVLLSRVLAEALDAERGDTIRVEIREGARPTLELPVVGLIDDVFGIQGYVQLSYLHRELGQRGAITESFLRIDDDRVDDIYHRLRDMPSVQGASKRGRMLAAFQDELDESIANMTLILIFGATVIVIGVVYNNARVALSMRGRELASLRVLGFTRGEVSFILLAEQFALVVLAIPIGWMLGSLFARALVRSIDPENFRFPMYISTQTYALTAVVTLLAALFSGFLVRRRLDQMDLTEVLKTRE